MIYYEVLKDSICLHDKLKPINYSVIAGEIFTKKECGRFKLNLNTMKKIEVSKQKTYFMFGRRKYIKD